MLKSPDRTSYLRGSWTWCYSRSIGKNPRFKTSLSNLMRPCLKVRARAVAQW